MTITINGTVYEQKFKPENVINCKFCDLSKSKYGNSKACHSVAERHCSDIITKSNQTGNTMPYFKKKRVKKQTNNNDNGQFSLF